MASLEYRTVLSNLIISKIIIIDIIVDYYRYQLCEIMKKYGKGRGGTPYYQRLCDYPCNL